MSEPEPTMLRERVTVGTYTKLNDNQIVTHTPKWRKTMIAGGALVTEEERLRVTVDRTSVVDVDIKVDGAVKKTFQWNLSTGCIELRLRYVPNAPLPPDPEEP